MKPATIFCCPGKGWGVIDKATGETVVSGLPNIVEVHDWCNEHGHDSEDGIPESFRQINREYIEKRRRELACTDLPLFAKNGGGR